MSTRIPKTIDEYLALLREALEGVDPAVVADALYDAEEHLYAELAQHPGQSEADVLEPFFASYGSPEEVAELYRASENMRERTQRHVPRPAQEHESPIAQYFHAFQDIRKYAALFFMLLAPPLGVINFVLVVTGLAITLPLAITIVGIPILWLFLHAVRALAVAESRLIDGALGVRLPRRKPPIVRGDGVWSDLRKVLADRQTWGSLLFLFISFPLGLLFLLTLGVATIMSGALITAPFWTLIVEGGGPPFIVALFMSVLGLAMFPGVLYATPYFARIQGWVARSLLVPRLEIGESSSST